MSGQSNTLFSTLIGAAMGTPESLVETAIPLLRPRFAASEPLIETMEAVIPSVAPADSAAAVPVLPHKAGFAPDMPAATTPHAAAPPLLGEAVQARQAPITSVQASEMPAPMLLAPTLAGQNAPSPMVERPILPESTPFSTGIAPVLLPISATDSETSTRFATPDSSESVGSGIFLPSPSEPGQPVHAAPAAMPSIAIHIGRIEVASPAQAAAPTTRSTSAAPPSAARISTIPRAAPRQSLDSYLAGRRR